MNKRLFYLFATALIALVLICSTALRAYLDSGMVGHARTTIAQRSALQLQRASESLRNDLLQDNFRGARNVLEGWRESGMFAAYGIYKQGVLVEASDNFKSLEKDPLSSKAEFKVQFGPDGPEWGSVVYQLSNYEVDELVAQLRRASLLNALSTAICIALILAGFTFLLRRSERGLMRFVESHFMETPPESSSHVSVLWSPLIEFVEKASTNAAEMRRQVREAKERTIVANLAQQVAHDIRSPLAALNMVVKSVDDLPEGIRLLIRSSVNRIRDIANDLLKKTQDTDSSMDVSSLNSPQPSETGKLSSELLPSLIDSLISEKRMQFRSKIGIQVDCALADSSYGVFAAVDSIELKRILSNLINNAVEVLGEAGRVSVTLQKKDQYAAVVVTDNGQGIPPEILARLGQRGETHGKEGGSGLGLYHARTTVESWGGRFEIDSTVGHGTAVALYVPLAPTPTWFVERIVAQALAKVVVVDDDASIHQIWNDRFEGLPTQLIHFSAPDQFKTWMAADGRSEASVTYLVDYELIGFRETGLDLIEQLSIENKAILVTSRFEEPHIRLRCEQLGVRLIPKGMAGFVPIVTA